MGGAFPGLAGFGPGSVLAGYRLEAQVGAGGMAVVFLARDERLGRPVALKILAPSQAADRELRHRFIAESRAAAAVDDPHIIPVYEAGEADGVLFIAMRFIQGGDLWQVLARERPLPPDRAAAFISPVASALDAAHRAGLVHRDVKPGNILVDARPDRPDHVYLSDFGISKSTVSSTAPTAAGRWVGTVDYAAPEQIQGRAVDGRADQYALACVAYQLLTGTVPFKRDQEIAVVYAHLSEPPPSLGSRRPGLPAAADQVLAKAMAKVPEKRFGSCREFADALRQALGLPPYISRGSAASGHPPAEAEAEVTAEVTAGAGTGTGTADRPAAVMMDGSGPADAATLPPRQRPGTAGEPGRPSAEPAGSTADPSGVQDAPIAGPARATLSRAGRGGHRAQPRRFPRPPGSGRRRWPMMTAALAVLVAIVTVGGYAVVQWTQGQYYLGDSNGQVVIYRGISDPARFLWLDLSHVYAQTGISFREVPVNYQQTVTAAYVTGSLSHVEQALGTIHTAVQACRSQYRAVQLWVVAEDKYQAEVAEAVGGRKATTGIPKPGPEPDVGAMCPPAPAFGISPNTLSPTSSGHS